jgi:DNA-binding NarL/FixJ family response regulator
LPPIRVLLVDDYDVVLDGLTRLLATDRQIEVVGLARDGTEAVAKAVRLAPDVVTMDLRMDGTDGIAATRKLKRRMPGIRVLALTMYGEDLIGQAVEAGVSGYVLKGADGEEILDAIHKVYEGRHPFMPSAGNRRQPLAAAHA